MFRFKEKPTLKVYHRNNIILDDTNNKCLINGRKYTVNMGMWMFYIPKTGEKFLHANNNMIDCIHSSRPSDLSIDCACETYSDLEWRSALTTRIDLRLAELLVVSRRLWLAGLGPRPLGITFADNLYRNAINLGSTAGLVVQNVYELPKKAVCTDEDLLRAGVYPDKIRSSVRQQLRGYVIDLCSVVGVKPIAAEEEVDAMLSWITLSRQLVKHNHEERQLLAVE